MTATAYDKFPVIPVPGSHPAWSGWPAIFRVLESRLRTAGTARRVLVIDAYPGVDAAAVQREAAAALRPVLVIDTLALKKPEADLLPQLAPYLTDDRIFGVLSPLALADFFDAGKLAAAQRRLAAVREGLVLVVGVGASLVDRGDLLVYADLARWEIQQRYRRGEGNWGADNGGEDFFRKYKRGYFVEWRAADRHKFEIFDRNDLFLDTTIAAPKLVEGEAVRAGLRHAASRPFRVVPFFDPAPWGGQWMKEVCDLDRSAPNFGWCFDCVPEENSLLLEIGGLRVELPALDLVARESRALLGQDVFDRFGAEFPIRFDFLDTMGGGNLSFQVHPLTDYIRRTFGLAYTQDESYYLLDAGPDACVYLGLREGVDREVMARDLMAAQSAAGLPFDADRYAHRWPAMKHDHFLIPAGTPHCSGRNAMVLEISATPYIFTFKMWDWGRLGLDGRPRPVHLQHALPNIQWERTTGWVKRELINRVEPLGRGDGWREERTGLHALEFIETRRHWFRGPVSHRTGGTVNVLNLVEGAEAVVESPSGAFAPFVVHYAETFIVPAAVGDFSIRPHGPATNSECATLKAFVRPGKA